MEALLLTEPMHALAALETLLTHTSELTSLAKGFSEIGDHRLAAQLQSLAQTTREAVQELSRRA